MAERSPAGHVNNATFSQGDLLRVVASNMNQTFIATPLNGSSFWNESTKGQTESGMYAHSDKSAEDEGRGEATSPGSCETDCCSLSSGEMVLRSKSFCLEEESPIVISSMEESSISPAASRLSFPVESNLLSTTLPDVCQAEEDAGHPCLGVTFTQAESLEDSYVPASSSVGSLPSESEGGLLTTFVCEPSADPINKAKSAEADCFSTTFTPEQGVTFVSPLQRNDGDILTSTPVQSLENNMLSLPSLSLCVGDSGSPGQQVPPSPARRPASFSVSKVRKMEFHKFSKLGLSTPKSNALTTARLQAAVPGSASQRRPLHAKRDEANGRTPVRGPLARSMTFTAVVSNVLYPRTQINKKAANPGVSSQPCRRDVDGQSRTRAFPMAENHVSPALCSNTSSEMLQGASSQASDASAPHAGSQAHTSLEKSPTTGGHMDSKPSPRKDASHKNEVRSGLAGGQDKMRPGCSSESSSASRLSRKRAEFKVASSFSPNKPASQKCPPQNKPLDETKKAADNSPREVKKISLVADPGKSAASGGPWDGRKSGPHVQPSPKQGRRATQPPPASPRPPPPLSARPRPGAPGKEEGRTCRGVGTTPLQQKNTAGCLRTEAPSLGHKPHLNGSLPPQSPRRSLMGPPLTTPYRLPRKTQGPSQALAASSTQSEPGQRSSSVSAGVPNKPAVLKPMTLRSRLISTPGKTSSPALTTTCKTAVSTSRGASSSAASPLKKTTNSRSGGPVDRSKSKAGSRQPPSQPKQSPGAQDGQQVEKKAQSNLQLPADRDRRFEAIVIVLQQALAKRDEAAGQCRELSQELLGLRGELACSVHSAQRLEKEKEELLAALEAALQQLQEQHQQDRAELEQRLQAFHRAEGEAARLAHQEEADRCKALMQQQLEELAASHEAVQRGLESRHAQQLQAVHQQHQTKLEELRDAHQHELQAVHQAVQDAEARLSGRIESLTLENQALSEKLAAEESRRKELAHSSQKDCHTLYLEQELESLKVVLEMKNQQLHQQEKKLLEVDKLTEKTVKLDESLTRVQQENEELKARMEKHAALSRQLSTEQLVLQQSLQKESKVNKRLSMENEELLWKLHNGDAGSPRRPSPSSAPPPHPFSLHSPRSAGLVSSPPLSPR